MPYQFNMEEEVICDHLVTAQMKKIWAVQLAMVDRFAQICEKHHLKWFASGGTLIGAVRHHGYIPWDDDIDIHMLVDDYEKFCQVAPAELESYYSWQECRTMDGAYPWHGKIRDARTTGATMWERTNWPDTMNKGIFIDIFPLYYIPESNWTRFWQIRRIKWYSHCIAMLQWHRKCLVHPDQVTPNWRRDLEFFFLTKRYTYRSLCEKFLAACQVQRTPTQFIGATSFNCKEPRFIWPVHNYREMVDLPFMGGTIKAPIEWDACLRRQYGDYMVIKKGTSMHSSILFDPDTPYAEKLKQL